MLKIKRLIICGAVAVLLGGTVAATGQDDAARVSQNLERAQQLYERGESAQALEIVNATLEIADKNPELRFMQGVIYADMGRNADAIDVFSELTVDYPELPEPWNNLAVLFAEKGEFDRARQALLAAIQTHPSYSTAHENLGDLYARMAGMAYDRALEQDRGNESARLKLSAVNGLFSVPSAARVAANTPPPALQPQPQPTVVAAVPVDTQPAPTRQTPPETKPASQVAVAKPPEEKPAVVTPPVVQSAPQTEPVATPSVADVEADIRNAVDNWAAAWSAQDIERYLASYAPNFRPSNGASRASWVRYRRDRLGKPSFIAVELSAVDISVANATAAKVTFSQRYRSDNYEDEVRKELAMTLTDSGWQISSEAAASR